LRKKKRPSVTATARKTRAPITVPAMAAIDVFLSDPEVVEGLGDDVSEVSPERVAVGLDVTVGADVVEEGERLFRHEASSVIPTLLRSEVPPLRL
jgi:hypothetical protein